MSDYEVAKRNHTLVQLFQRFKKLWPTFVKLFHTHKSQTCI